MAYGAKRRPADGVHRVREGETISSIAAAYGFTEWEERVWNAPENAALKEQRVNPNTLEPGDEEVQLRALKDHDNPDLSELHVALDSRTLLLVRS